MKNARPTEVKAGVLDMRNATTIPAPLPDEADHEKDAFLAEAERIADAMQADAHEAYRFALELLEDKYSDDEQGVPDADDEMDDVEEAMEEAEETMHDAMAFRELIDEIRCEDRLPFYLFQMKEDAR